MELQTVRLSLREIETGNTDSIHQLLSLPEVDRYNTLGLPAHVNITAAWVNEWITMQQVTPRNKYVLYITTGTNEFVGLVGINMGKPNYRHAEFWYKLHPEHWNKGYATEVVEALLSFCFDELRLHRITAGCATNNIASIKVLEKCGFQREAHHRKILPIRGEWVDNYEFAILEEDFMQAKTSKDI